MSLFQAFGTKLTGHKANLTNLFISNSTISSIDTTNGNLHLNNVIIQDTTFVVKDLSPEENPTIPMTIEIINSTFR